MIKITFALSLFALSVFPAQAEDYFVDGLFVLSGLKPAVTAEDKARLQLKCGLTFFVNQRDGSFQSYFLDRDQFQRSGTISYIKVGDGTCQFDKAMALEHCNSVSQYDGKVVPDPQTFNSYLTLSQDLLDAKIFESVQTYQSWKTTGKPDPMSSFIQHRCSDISFDKVKGLLSRAMNTHTQEQSFAAQFFSNDPSEEDYELAKKVIEQLK